jgi:UDP-N-acetylglucosamine:LPS N-acetylglucosamine transferase
VRTASEGKVLILTASMGAGHDGVAHEVARRFEECGYQPEVLDLLELLPLALGSLLRTFYLLQLRWTPWLYEIIYRVWFQSHGRRDAPVSPVTVLAERRLRRWIADNKPVLAVSTFHLCSTVLGDLRRQGALTVPTVTVVVDFAVHHRWTDSDVDLHLCLHPRSAEEARQLGAPRVTAPGPIVCPRFTHPAWDRRSARASLGLAPEVRVVLIVAGSWGAGDVVGTVDVIRRCPRLTPLVVCGADDRLRQRLRQRARPGENARVMGWVGDMDRLMAAADVVLENAGGLTCMEALALGRPVVSFRPLPGHGRANVEAMAEAGLVNYVRRPEDLVVTLEQAEMGAPLSHAEGIDDMVDLALRSAG